MTFFRRSLQSSKSNSTTSISSLYATPNSVDTLTPEFVPEVIDDELNSLHFKFTNFALDDEVVDIASETATEASGVATMKTSPSLRTGSDVKWCVLLVGLPASGKSTVVRQLKQYLTTGTKQKCRVEIYNAGNVRRSQHPKRADSGFFEFGSTSTNGRLRETFARDTLAMLLGDLQNDHVDIGILDATNSTRERRKSLLEQIHAVSPSTNIQTLILEVQCTNKSMRRFNIERKAQNADYIHIPRDVAVKDFFNRVQVYESHFEPVSAQELASLKLPYLSMINVGEEIIYNFENAKQTDFSLEDPIFLLICSFVTEYRTQYAPTYLMTLKSFYASEYAPLVSTPLAFAATSAETASTQ
ncbi:6-phosphofructo-2-kinase 2 [Komagataella phaffii CBS 7435]|uniref:6-phosphofructo-2-kinase n=2 Tax=Komagataella phaffii TaxID=460519 RepID=C4QZC1_KOMPG|nr:6-phosphofructo-2-kinase [Komagataella phaffii GS115]AOA61492.1 GQ67_01397T0 [Komagataella phaffii]CAH2447427.1 6-phosphofructo-2-kinase 2 [Komagataella phaffii CBS 7435]AOA66023.1 GQ68_01413T0 [Komagataella phaffii GS115]CAY68595.1 6-phosphofructo-2-kinase [Komagataella phaffii GS115]SCV11951.1 6-phosphofructo-2-kinase 2 [Komagataella phaffii CBS 7435]